MAQKKPETSHSLQNLLGTPDAAPLPKAKEAPKKGNIKKVLKTATLVTAGAGIVAGGIWGADELMTRDTASATQSAQKMPAFKPLTLQQQVDIIAQKMKEQNMSLEQIQAAQQDLLNTIEKSDMLKRVPGNEQLSKELDAHILKTLNANLKTAQTVGEAVARSYAQTRTAFGFLDQPARVHNTQAQIPFLNGAYVNLTNAWPDSAGNPVRETDLLKSAVTARYMAAAAFFNGYKPIEAQEALIALRGLCLEPDLAFAIEKSYQNTPNAEKALKRFFDLIQENTKENMNKASNPHAALCAAVAQVSGVDQNDSANPSAIALQAYAATNSSFTGADVSWITQMKPTEKKGGLPTSLCVVGALGLLAGGCYLYKGIGSDTRRGVGKWMVEQNRKDKKEKNASEVNAAMNEIFGYAPSFDAKKVVVPPKNNGSGR